LARESGLLFGGSAGLVVCGAVAWLKQSSARKVVAIIPDTGANYLDQIYNNAWLAEKGVSVMERRELDECLKSKSIHDAEKYCREQRSETITEDAAFAKAVSR
jgi:hypothetical protein